MWKLKQDEERRIEEGKEKEKKEYHDRKLSWIMDVKILVSADGRGSREYLSVYFGKV